MNAVTKFGRQKEDWELFPSQFCKRGWIVEGSQQWNAIHNLSNEEFEELTQLCDPEEDNLIHVDSYGCTINHGNVGSKGISYEWR